MLGSTAAFILFWKDSFSFAEGGRTLSQEAAAREEPNTESPKRDLQQSGARRVMVLK